MSDRFQVLNRKLDFDGKTRSQTCLVDTQTGQAVRCSGISVPASQSFRNQLQIEAERRNKSIDEQLRNRNPRTDVSEPIGVKTDPMSGQPTPEINTPSINPLKALIAVAGAVLILG